MQPIFLGSAQKFCHPVKNKRQYVKRVFRNFDLERDNITLRARIFTVNKEAYKQKATIILEGLVIQIQSLTLTKSVSLKD